MKTLSQCKRNFEKSAKKHHFFNFSESNNRSNISEITENLLLCGAIGIKPDVLKQLNITCVINAAPELPDTPLPEECTIYRRISVNDCRDSNISDYFDEVADLIEKVSRFVNLLVNS